MKIGNHNGDPSQANYAAVFIDYENLLYHLKKEYADPPQVHDIILDILRSLRVKLNEEMNLDTIILKAYADFERIATTPLGSLYLMGVETHNVLGTEHKNAADMQLCIHLMEVFYTRPDISHFVMVAGDRDYIPIVQYLRSKARKVMAVAFRKSISGDLRLILGENNIMEAYNFIPQTAKDAIKKHTDTVISQMGLKVVGKIELPQIIKPAAVVATVALPVPEIKKELPKEEKPAVAKVEKSIYPHTEIIAPPEFKNIKAIAGENNLICLRALLLFTLEKNVIEVWLTPFLRTLRDKMPLLADYERKELINTLQIFGAISVVKRTSDTNDYSVIHINYNHPTVIKEMP